jgi:hypothetical protein
MLLQNSPKYDLVLQISAVTAFPTFHWYKKKYVFREFLAIKAIKNLSPEKSDAMSCIGWH